MANSSIVLSNLDFDSLKNNLKQYLQTQSVFRDYDFEASNINVLLDVLSYNTYLNSFYLNMVSSEMFLDTAQKYDSVISHSKELNYLPKSTKSSVATINLTINSDNLDGVLTVPKGSRFTGINANGSFIFTTRESVSVTSSNSTYVANSINLYEGDYFNDTYVVDYNVENQQFVLSNENVDLDSISVNVISNSGANNTPFYRSENLLGLGSESEIYFIQPSFNNLYEVYFGNDIFGKRPLNGSIVQIQYRVASGNASNGVSKFTLVSDLGPINNGNINRSSTVTVSNSAGGASKESIDSIKFSAPRYFATQQRAVSSNDYAALVLSKFSGEIADVNVYGGQELEPKLYGRVAISIKPTVGEVAPDYLKNAVNNYLLDYISLPNRVIVTNPDIFYCNIQSTVQLNTTKTLKSINEVKSLVTEGIVDFGETNLNKFNNDFRYSRFVTYIDNLYENISSNDTQVRLSKRIMPVIGERTSFNIKFNNELEARRTLCSGYLHNSVVLTTNKFSYIREDNTIVDEVQIKDNGAGVLQLYKVSGNVLTVVSDNIGSIDYVTGEVSVNQITIADYSDDILFLVNTKNKDIIASKNMILLITGQDTTVGVIEILK